MSDLPDLSKDPFIEEEEKVAALATGFLIGFAVLLVLMIVLLWMGMET